MTNCSTRAPFPAFPPFPSEPWGISGRIGMLSSPLHAILRSRRSQSARRFTVPKGGILSQAQRRRKVTAQSKCRRFSVRKCRSTSKCFMTLSRTKGYLPSQNPISITKWRGKIVEVYRMIEYRRKLCVYCPQIICGIFPTIRQGGRERLGAKP